MNKIIFFFVCLMISAFAQAEIGSLKYRTAAFFPVGHRFTRIYGDVTPDYQLEFSKGVCSNIAAWVNSDLFLKHGKIHHCGRSKIHAVNFSFGPKLVYPLACHFNFYVGIGASVARTYVRDGSHCGSHRRYKMAVGGIFKSGIEICMYQNLFVDIFADYLYQPIHFHKTVDIGGLKAGIGLGARL